MEINPNSKIPALHDRRAGANDQRVFESGSILLYLSEAFDGAFLPKVARYQKISYKSQFSNIAIVLTGAIEANGGPQLAVLADGQRTVPGWRLRAFLRLCAREVNTTLRPKSKQFLSSSISYSGKLEGNGPIDQRC